MFTCIANVLHCIMISYEELLTKGLEVVKIMFKKKFIIFDMRNIYSQDNSKPNVVLIKVDD